MKSSHNIRFGIQAQFRKFEHLTEVPPRGTFAFNGMFSGSPIADFLLGYCSTCTGAFGNSLSHYTSPTIAPFIDDVWQVSSRLTMQAGLRWEYSGAVARDPTTSKACSTRPAARSSINVVPTNLPAQLVPLVNPQQGAVPPGIIEEGPEQLGSARSAWSTT